MRTIPAAAQTALNTQYGTEPLLIVEIEWADGGKVAYADRQIDPSIRGQLVEIGTIDSAATADSSTDSTQVEIKLDDVDGQLRALFDTHDFHKRPVWIYQWFAGLALTDKFLLFKGEINSPVSWGEGDRVLSFTVTTRIEDVEAGFSMEEGDFPVVPADALGKAWPLGFGSPCDVKAVQVRAPRYGILQAGEGIHDYTLESRICQAGYVSCPGDYQGKETTLLSGTTPQVKQDPTTGLYDWDPATVTIAERWGADPSCVEEAAFTLCSLRYDLAQQLAYEHPTMTIQGGENFPQGKKITLNIDGGKFTGTFSGNVFTISSREHPDFAINPPGQCTQPELVQIESAPPVDQTAFKQTSCTDCKTYYNAAAQSGNASDCAGTAEERTENISNDADVAAMCERLEAYTKTHLSGPGGSQAMLDRLPTSNFFWARAGSKVYMEDEAEVLFIVNLLPSTITRVAAYKQTNFGPKLMTVPASYYTIYETNYGGYTVCEISMTKPLSQRSEIITEFDGSKRVEQSKWSDDLYVSFTSSVGPNPADVIQWLIEKYTSLMVDTTSFAHVHTHLVNYSCGFALAERRNVMQLIAEIAVQSRCVVYIRNDVVYLKYFSEEPTSAATIAESDVLVNTLKLSLTRTEDVATKHTVVWMVGGSEEGKRKMILKHNIAKYGTHAKDHDYYTLNIFENVQKSATFWMIRDANCWRQVEFSLPLKHLALEVFDCVTLNLSDVAPTPVKAVITSLCYNPTNNQLDLVCWTPLKAGEIVPYVFAWPAGAAAGAIFPTAEERLAGLGYTFTVTPPVGHLLYAPLPDDGNPPAVLTSGDPHPSDLDDVLLTCFCPSTDDAVVDERDPIFYGLKKAERAVQESRAQQAKAPDAKCGSGTSTGKGKDRESCGSPSYGDGCIYEVTVTYATAYLVGHGCGGPCRTCTTPPTVCRNVVCSSALSTMCHTFGSLFAASLFASNMQAEIGKWRHCCSSNCNGLFGTVFWAATGETFPFAVHMKSIADPTSYAGGCATAPGQSPDGVPNAAGERKTMEQTATPKVVANPFA